MPRIKVVFEFIPVEERLPEYGGCSYLARIVHSSGDPITVDRVTYDDGWAYPDGIDAENDHWRITHWAEIPKIEWPVEANNP